MRRDDYDAPPGSSSQPRVGSAAVHAQRAARGYMPSGSMASDANTSDEEDHDADDAGTEDGQQAGDVNTNRQDAASDTSVTDPDSDDGSESDDPSSGKTGRNRYACPDGRVKWTTVETNCFTKALKRTICVPGPHQSQPYVTILALHGRKGYLNEKLKDRNPLQLKDKARNIATDYRRGKNLVPYWKRYLCPAEYVSIAPHACAIETRVRLTYAYECTAQVDGKIPRQDTPEPEEKWKENVYKAIEQKAKRDAKKRMKRANVPRLSAKQRWEQTHETPPDDLDAEDQLDRPSGSKSTSGPSKKKQAAKSGGKAKSSASASQKPKGKAKGKATTKARGSGTEFISDDDDDNNDDEEEDKERTNDAAMQTSGCNPRRAGNLSTPPAAQPRPRPRPSFGKARQLALTPEGSEAEDEQQEEEVDELDEDDEAEPNRRSPTPPPTRSQPKRAAGPPPRFQAEDEVRRQFKKKTRSAPHPTSSALHPTSSKQTQPSSSTQAKRKSQRVRQQRARA